MKKIAAILAITTWLVTSPSAGSAQERWHGDIHHFHEYDMGRWHGGYWNHGFHGGRDGWWWVVGGEWYFYPQPVYPYPDPYMPPAVVMPQPGGQYYWYCQNPAGYYPYVPACYTQWQPMPATAAIQQPVVAPPLAAPVSQPGIVPAPQQTESDNIRDADDRQLDTFASEFYAVNPKERGAVEHLKSLKSRVEAFRQLLFEKHYNAMDILKDTENLEKRIDKKESQILNRDNT